MNKEEKEKLLSQPEYTFLKTEERLKNNIILLGLAGSYSYGTHVPTSDIDIRGLSRNTKEDLLGLNQQTNTGLYTNENTDTTIYTLTHAIPLLLNCNPNMVEMLGLREEDYLRLAPDGRKLIDNQQIFYSKKAQYSFGGYATAQLRRLQNALARDSYPAEEKQRHILGSLENAIQTFNNHYTEQYEVTVAIHNNKLVTSMTLQNYPLQDAYGMFSEMRAIIREYDKLNHRNQKKDDAHLNKHAMHLVRLLSTGTELLETGIMHTYRETEHDLLMDIRNGKFQNPDHTFNNAFFELIDQLETRFQYAAEHSVLPDKPDIKQANEILIDINTQTILQSSN